MNEYKDSMKDILLSEEAKDRIAGNVADHFEKNPRKSKILSISGLVKVLVPVTAAAAVVIAVIVADPFGRTKSAMSYMDGFKGEAASDIRDNDVQETTQNISTNTPSSMGGMNNGTIYEQNGIGGRTPGDIKSDKHSVSESTLASYSLNGMTPEQFFKNSIGKYNVVEETRYGASLNVTEKEYRLVFLGDEYVERAFWVSDDTIYVVSFAYPVSVKTATDAVSIYIVTNGELQ